MALSFVGVSTSGDATPAAIPTGTAVGDLMIAKGFDNSATAPSVPSGWTLITTASRSGAAQTICFRIFQSGDSGPVWAGVTSNSIISYTGQDPTDAIGAVNSATGTTTTLTMPSVTLEVTDGTSWVVALYGHRQGGGGFNTPTGMTERWDAADGAIGQAGSDTNGGVASFSGGTFTLVGGSSAAWACTAIEIFPAATGDPPSEGSASGTITWAGSATGQMAPQGSATGSVSFAGAATGARASLGSASGSVAFSGTATGARTPKGAASGTITWAGSATGEAPIEGVNTGSAAGTITWAGTATGAMQPKGSATGTVAWVGAATGEAPATINSGTASGTIAWAGSATGARMSLGSASATILWTGLAVGEGVDPTFFFSPPTHEEPFRTKYPPLSYYRMTYAASIVRVNGSFVAMRVPAPHLLDGLEEGVDYFRGGYEYTITQAVAQELQAAGYTVGGL